MSLTAKANGVCSKCGQTTEITVYKSINTADNPELKENGILVQCKEGSLWISELHPAGKRPMPAYDYAMGHALKAGEKVFD